MTNIAHFFIKEIKQRNVEWYTIRNLQFSFDKEIKGYFDRKPLYSIPCFSKVYFTLLHFYKRPTLVPVFANQKKFEDSCFYKKSQKAKQVLSI